MSDDGDVPPPSDDARRISSSSWITAAAAAAAEHEHSRLPVKQWHDPPLPGTFCRARSSAASRVGDLLDDHEVQHDLLLCTPGSKPMYEGAGASACTPCCMRRAAANSFAPQRGGAAACCAAPPRWRS